MSILGLFNKKDASRNSEKQIQKNIIKSVKVLGAGCKSCHEQYENVKKAVYAMGINIEIEYITDMEKVMSYGVMSMPAIVVNEKVVSMGNVLKAADVVKLLQRVSK